MWGDSTRELIVEDGRVENARTWKTLPSTVTNGKYATLSQPPLSIASCAFPSAALSLTHAVTLDGSRPAPDTQLMRESGSEGGERK